MAQRLPACETIVVDDGSIDDTPRVLDGYGDRIRVIRNERRSGSGTSRNRAASQARGELIAFLDADDRWLPGFLEQTAQRLSAARQAVLAFSDVLWVDAAGAPTKPLDPSHRRDAAPTMDDLLTRWWPILPSAVVMRREIFEACGGFYPEFITPGYEDPWLWLRARELGEFEYVNQPLVMYRVTPEFERMLKYQNGFRIFIRLVKERYGARGRELIRSVRHGYASVVSHQGLLDIQRGQLGQARANFLRALRMEPCSLRNALRLARTVLPAPLAARLSGRTRLAAQAAARATRDIQMARSD